MKFNFLKAFTALALIASLVFSCKKSEMENEKESSNILQQAEVLAQMHNDGLDFIHKNNVSLKSSGSLDLKSNLIVTSIDFLNENNQKLSDSFTTLKSSTTDLDAEINKVFTDFPSINDIVNYLSEPELYYYNKIQDNRSILSDNKLLEEILSEVLDDQKLSDEQKLGVCTFIKTMEYSKIYWDENKSEWQDLNQSARLKQASDVVLADGMYLWIGTLGGGPVVGIGAGAVASAFTALTN